MRLVSPDYSPKLDPFHIHKINNNNKSTFLCKLLKEKRLEKGEKYGGNLSRGELIDFVGHAFGPK